MQLEVSNKTKYANLLKLSLAFILTIAIIFSVKGKILTFIVNNLDTNIQYNIDMIKKILNLTIMLSGILFPILIIIGNSLVIFLIIKFYSKDFKFSELISKFCNIYIALLPIKVVTFLVSSNFKSDINGLSINRFFGLSEGIGRLLNSINVETIIFYILIYNLLRKEIKFDKLETTVILSTYFILSSLVAVLA
ncbi:MAG: hypothetical protein ACLTT7_02980 [Paraclostridium bifermentans]